MSREAQLILELNKTNNLLNNHHTKKYNAQLCPLSIRINDQTGLSQALHNIGVDTNYSQYIQKMKEDIWKGVRKRYRALGKILPRRRKKQVSE